MNPARRRTERADARQQAFEILLRVERAGAFASILLTRAEAALDDSRDTALLHELVLGVLRRQSALDHALGLTARRPPDAMDPEVRVALRLGAYSLLFLDRVPDYAAVDGAVRLVKRRRGAARAAGFVNATLRQLARLGKRALPPAPQPGDVEGLARFHSHPPWMVRRLVGRQGWVAAARLLEADNSRAATVLRTNLRQVTTSELADRLRAEGLDPQPCDFAPDALRLTGGAPQRSPSIRAGLAWVQDEASQLVPLLLGPHGPGLVADFCAAPGAKTFQLAEGLPPGGAVVAVDRHLGRLRRLTGLARRLGAEAVWPVAADLARPVAPLRGRFAAILVDAPCSGTGTLRRHPEIRWRLRESDLERLAARQAQLLETASALLAPGGCLVYSVCSLEPEEGEQRIEALLARHPELRLEDPRSRLPAPCASLVRDPGFLRTSPVTGGLDGFFAARMVRERG